MMQLASKRTVDTTQYPLTITMRKLKKRTRKATAVDADALNQIRSWIMDNWREGFNLKIETA